MGSHDDLQRAAHQDRRTSRLLDLMKTLYAACLSRLGLSQSEAADLHGARLDTVKSWSSGRNPVAAGAWADLRAYEAKIVDRSGAILEAWKNSGEAREISIQTHGDPATLMAAANFFLSTDETPPIEAPAREIAKQTLRARAERPCNT